MADSDITILGLSVKTLFSGFQLTWVVDDPHVGGLNYLGLDQVEVWTSETNSRATATKVAEAKTSATVEISLAILQAVGRFFWLRPRNVAGYYGAWFPSDTTGSGIWVTTPPRQMVIDLATSNNALTPKIVLGATLSGNSDRPALNVYDFETKVFSLGWDTFERFGFDIVSSIDGTIPPGLVKSTNHSGFAFYAGAGSYGPFTGAHDGLIDKAAVAEVGDVLCDVEILSRSSVSDTLAVVEPSKSNRSPKTIGILAKRFSIEPATRTFAAVDGDASELVSLFDRVMMNALGEGQINVCGQNGAIEAGDLLVTSDVPGKAMRQDDDIVRSCTVARAREGAAVATADDRAQIACIYLCG